MNANIMDKQPLLSICIPTYNRAQYLNNALDCLFSNQKSCTYDVEILISDNHATDETPNIINSKISEGLKCTYIRNDRNIGPDANFVQCFNRASGKYIWLIGDDDYLESGSVTTVCKYLENNDYGLIHIENNSCEINAKPYTDVCQFLSDINIMITFISANIIRKDIVTQINGAVFFNTYLVQVPYYISSALLKPNNLSIKGQLLSCGHNSQANGGYNFFQVFMVNYFTIWEEYVEKGCIKERDYKYIKKITFERFHLDYVFRTLIGQPSQSLDMSGCKEITYKYFGHNNYLYTNLFKRYIEYLWRQFRHKIHMTRLKLMKKR